ncbi:MAG: thiamine diphosphokinase [Stomatobaculum sp.]
MTGMIIAGGVLEPAFAEKMLEKAEEEEDICLAAVDGGLEICDRIGRSPQLLIGDFDTVRQSVLEKYLHVADTEVRHYNPAKDASDLELAVEALFHSGIRRATVLGALGGRVDHSIANILLTCRAASRGMALTILDPLNRIRSFLPGESGVQEVKIRRDEQWGDYVGFFPAGGDTLFLSLEGFRYPLENFPLSEKLSPTRAISNEITAETGIIRFLGGRRACLIVTETRDRGRS